MRSLIDARSKVLLTKTIGKFIKMLSNYLITRGKAFKLAKYLKLRDENLTNNQFILYRLICLLITNIFMQFI